MASLSVRTVPPQNHHGRSRSPWTQLYPPFPLRPTGRSALALLFISTLVTMQPTTTIAGPHPRSPMLIATTPRHPAQPFPLDNRCTHDAPIPEPDGPTKPRRTHAARPFPLDNRCTHDAPTPEPDGPTKPRRTHAARRRTLAARSLPLYDRCTHQAPTPEPDEPIPTPVPAGQVARPRHMRSTAHNMRSARSSISSISSDSSHSHASTWYPAPRRTHAPARYKRPGRTNDVTDSPSPMHSPWGRGYQHSHTRADQLTANAFHQDSLHSTRGGGYQRFNASAFQGSSITALQRSSVSVSQQSKPPSLLRQTASPSEFADQQSFYSTTTSMYPPLRINQPHSNVARQTMPSILLNGNTDIHDTSIQRSTIISFHLNE